MPHNRFFLDAPLTGESITLTDEEHQHLLVMRLRKAEELEIVNGKGDLATGTIVEVAKKETYIELTSHHHDATRSGITLCQALPKFPNLQLIVEKCTELGVDTISIFPSERSEKYTLSTSQMERLEKITIAALKQSGRLLLPKIEWLKEMPRLTGSITFGDLETKNKMKGGETHFINGPEKGFSEKELSEMKKLGYVGISLGPHILRTETAAIAACAKLI